MNDIIDLDAYPLDDLASEAGTTLIDRCRSELAENGLSNLDGFLRPDVAAATVREIGPIMATRSFRHARSHNIYFKPVPGLPPDHPALVQCETVNHTVCADQMADSIVCRIYEWAPLTRFLEAVLGKPALYQMADPLARVNVMCYRRGEALNWHFDRCEFTVTLLLQAAEAGGEFQYRRDLRSEHDPNHDGVARLLQGLDTNVRTMPFAAGTLSIFKGKNTAHRVSPVQGDRERLIAVYSYYEEPGVLFSDEERIGFYGRAA